MKRRAAPLASADDGSLGASKKRRAFKREVRALNEAFAAYIKQQIKIDRCCDLADAAQDYMAFAANAEDRLDAPPGQLMSFGSGDCGQLAHGVDCDRNMLVPRPRAIQSLRAQRFSAVACGGLHNIALTSDGSLVSWGCNDDEALGRPGDENVPAPITAFPSATVIAQVSAGDSHSLALTITGQVFAWGSYKDNDGKHWFDAGGAAPALRNKQSTPFLISALPTVTQIASGFHHSLARTNDGRLFSWGLDEVGALGRAVSKVKDSEGDYLVADVTRTQLTPRPVCGANGAPVKSVMFCAGGGYHSLFLTSGAHVFTCGLNNYGQLGMGDLKNRVTPQLVQACEKQQVFRLAGGEHHSAALAADGALYMFGRGDSGQLGISAEPIPDDCSKTPAAVVGIPLISNVALGGAHTLALSRDGDLWVWGYGEMYQLGTGSDSEQRLPQRVACKALGKRVVLHADGGGQHSVLIASNPSTAAAAAGAQ